MLKTIALLIGWLLDLRFGDPPRLPHPIVLFGKLISAGEKRLNRGNGRFLKGAALAVSLILATYAATWLLLHFATAKGHSALAVAISAILIFYCLAGTTLIREVRQVFVALNESLERGREQVGRIVGRNTEALSAQEVRTAALETLAENLSDGVVAPLFWLLLLGVPGMMAYKMVNTLDSMIGYRTDRYRQFGCVAARIDDVANWIPARLTALLMLVVAKKTSRLQFVWRYGRQHTSPNSGYPEAALAAILDCQFGGTHTYFGEVFPKPYIGDNPRELTWQDMETAVTVNRRTELLMVALVVLFSVF